jgi:hypothetical protein
MPAMQDVQRATLPPEGGFAQDSILWVVPALHSDPRAARETRRGRHRVVNRGRIRLGPAYAWGGRDIGSAGRQIGAVADTRCQPLDRLRSTRACFVFDDAGLVPKNRALLAAVAATSPRRPRAR